MHSRPWIIYVSVFVLPVVASIAFIALVSAEGPHATQHAAGAAVGVVQGAIALWLIARMRLAIGRLPLIAFGVLLVGWGYLIYGNIRVAVSIWGKPWDDDQAAAFGESVAGFAAGHEAGATSDVLIVVGGILFATAVFATWRRHRIAAGVAAVFAFTPPWTIPAISATVLLAHMHVWRTRDIAVPKSTSDAALQRSDTFGE